MSLWLIPEIVGGLQKHLPYICKFITEKYIPRKHFIILNELKDLDSNSQYNLIKRVHSKYNLAPSTIKYSIKSLMDLGLVEGSSKIQLTSVGYQIVKIMEEENEF